MPTPNVPDITSPARRSLTASIGVTANYGTSQGQDAVGGTNNSIGGTVYNGVDTVNNFPKNQSVLTKTNSGGASFTPIAEASSFPGYVTTVAAAARSTENVVSNSSATVPAIGKIVNFPKTNVVISEKINGYYEIKQENILSNQNGIQQTDYLVNDLTKIAEDVAQVEANPNKKLDGADFPLGDPTIQDREGLPGGVSNSAQVGNNADTYTNP